jgi:hypothetical protein
MLESAGRTPQPMTHSTTYDEAPQYVTRLGLFGSHPFDRMMSEMAMLRQQPTCFYTVAADNDA